MSFIPRMSALVVVEYYPWFTFYFFCFKLIILPITIPQRIKLNHNIMIVP